MGKLTSLFLFLSLFLSGQEKQFSNEAEKRWEFNFNLSEDVCPGVLPMASIRFSLDDAGNLIGLKVKGDCLELNKELEKLFRQIQSTPPTSDQRGKVYIITVGIVPVEKVQ